MTLLGFSMGTTTTSSDPVTMDMSLDQMIENRRKDSSKPTRSTRSNAAPRKSVSNVDRSIGTSRAKRNAAMRARRGMTQSAKPTAMEVEKEVKKQVRISNTVKVQKEKKKQPARKASTNAKKSGAEKAESRRSQRAAKKNTVKPAPTKKVNTNKQQRQQQPPTKKMVGAAVAAMKEKGFEVPKGMQVVISVAPRDTGGAKKNNNTGGNGKQQQAKGGQQSKKGGNNNNNNRRGGRK